MSLLRELMHVMSGLLTAVAVVSTFLKVRPLPPLMLPRGDLSKWLIPVYKVTMVQHYTGIQLGKVKRTGPTPQPNPYSVISHIDLTSEVINFPQTSLDVQGLELMGANADLFRVILF